MKSLFILAGLFSLPLFGSITSARKDPGEHWQGVKKDEHCGSSNGLRNFEPMPNISAYNDDSKINEKKNYLKDFEPRPNVSAYNDDIKPESIKNSITDEFEPRPNVSAYTDDTEKSFVKDFEPRPNVSAYGDDAVGE